jgi:hypothetical protein
MFPRDDIGVTATDSAFGLGLTTFGPGPTKGFRATFPVGCLGALAFATDFLAAFFASAFFTAFLAAFRETFLALFAFFGVGLAFFATRFLVTALADRFAAFPVFFFFEDFLATAKSLNSRLEWDDWNG